MILFGLEYGLQLLVLSEILRLSTRRGLRCVRVWRRADREKVGRTRVMSRSNGLRHLRSMICAPRLRTSSNAPTRTHAASVFLVLAREAAGFIVAADEPAIRCCVGDSIFSTYTTMVPYMIKWVGIFTHRQWVVDLAPKWYFRFAASRGLQNLERDRHCKFACLETSIRRIAPRPVLMIHGSADNYIKPEMAQALFAMAGKPKEFWLVEAQNITNPSIRPVKNTSGVFPRFSSSIWQRKILALPARTPVLRESNLRTRKWPSPKS